MPQKKLTEKSVDALAAPHPSGRQVMYWDTELRGFGVRVSGKTNDKSFVVQRAINGLTRRITIGSTELFKVPEARERALGHLGDFARGIDPKAKKAGSDTLGAVLDDYLAAVKDLRPRTRESYRAAIDGHLKIWRDKPLSSISRDMVERRLVEIASEVAARESDKARRDAAKWEQRAKTAERKGWGDAAANYRQRAAIARKRETNSGQVAANNAMKVLRALWNYAADKNPEMGSNPAKLKKQVGYPVEPRTRDVEPEDLPAFYKAVTELESTVARDYILMLLFCGTRRRETASLKWSDVDLKGRVLHIAAARTKPKRKLDLPLSDFVHDLLVARRSLGGEWVFPANSRSGHIEEPKFHFAQVAEASGIRVSCHDLRRTFTTAAESCEMSTIALQALVNHSPGRGVTPDYVQMRVERLREPAQRVCDRLKQLCGIAEPEGKNVARLKRRESAIVGD